MIIERADEGSDGGGVGSGGGDYTVSMCGCCSVLAPPYPAVVRRRLSTGDDVKEEEKIHRLGFVDALYISSEAASATGLGRGTVLLFLLQWRPVTDFIARSDTRFTISISFRRHFFKKNFSLAFSAFGGSCRVGASWWRDDYVRHDAP